MFRKIYFLLLLVQKSFDSVLSATDYKDPHFVDNRTVIVQLMEWKFSDIAKECEQFLGPYRYGGVQLSPVAEYAILVKRPWHERYQPVSYKIVSRSGTEDQLKDMIERCNGVGVRVYVDVVLNHMTAESNGTGTGGSYYNATMFDNLDYEGIPFHSDDFHGYPNNCPNIDLKIYNYTNPVESRNCQLYGYRDLNQGQEWVRQKQIQLLNTLIDMGVTGFRVDSALHMWPRDLTLIFQKLNHLNVSYFEPNSKPFIYQDISDGNNPEEYSDIGRIIEFRYIRDLCEVLRKLNNQSLNNLMNFGEGWGHLRSEDSLVMIDNHWFQRSNDPNNIAYYEPKLLKMATAFMLSWPYGVPKVMSSYYWPRNITNKKDGNVWMGPPSLNEAIIDVKFNGDLSCNKEWICEHRWRQIYNMVEFRNIAVNENVSNWWDNGRDAIAFSRGDKAFIAINNDKQILDKNLQTGLPSGNYCDIISGNKNKSGKCSGKQIIVNRDGTAHIIIDNLSDDPIIAFHINSKIV